MAKRCTKCGNFLMDDERFCSRCGENVGDIPFRKESVNIGAPDYTSNSQTAPGTDPNQRMTAATSHNYNYAPPPAVPAAADEMTFGKWFVTVLVTQMFGIISIIFLFVWGFGQGPKSRQNYCKAMLIVRAISIVIGIIIGAFYLSILGMIINEISGQYPDWQNHIQDYFTSILAII